MGKDFLQYFTETILPSLGFDTFVEPAIILGAALIIMAPLIDYFTYSRLIQRDIARLNEGLPIEVEITPEEIRLTPDLEEIYGTAADDGFLVFSVESHEQYLRNQRIANLLFDYINNHPQANQLWTIYSYIEPILEMLF